MYCTMNKFSDERDQDPFCCLSARGYGMLEIDKPAERMKAILRTGEEAMRAYFDNRSAPSATTSTS
jgi:hypothetical protein